MKKTLLILVILASFYSCTKEADDVAKTIDYTGEWELIKMTGSFAGSETIGSDMEWQETYLINEDETFTKTRVRGDSTSTVSGIYTFTDDGLLDETADVVIYIEFLHNSKNVLIGNCYSNRSTEYLYFNSKNEMKSTWEACDGPGLKYLNRK